MASYDIAKLSLNSTSTQTKAEVILSPTSPLTHQPTRNLDFFKISSELLQEYCQTDYIQLNLFSTKIELKL